jgi:2-polyprenyl-3-methyl-5-hydroxy-6-metoxy-1,4-benzoquinol methylase
MRVGYALWSEAWGRFDSRLIELIQRDGARTICEIGGGANPALSLPFVRENDLDYVVVDVSAEELAKAPAGYRTLVANVESSDVDLPNRYDVIFSRMVAEHISSPAHFHRNIYAHLRPNGLAFHFFPTLYTLPYLVNRVVPESLARQLLHGTGGGHEKFPAYYRWCRGPSRRQIRRLKSVGYDVEEYVGFFGHGYYGRLRPVQTLSDALAAGFVRRPVPLVTSYAQVILRRPGTRGEPSAEVDVENERT